MGEFDQGRIRVEKDGGYPRDNWYERRGDLQVLESLVNALLYLPVRYFCRGCSGISVPPVNQLTNLDFHGL